MIETELYKYVNGIRIPGHSYEELGGILVSSSQSPFRKDCSDVFSIVASRNITHNKGVADRLLQITEKHGRSYELALGQMIKVLHSDEFGNFFLTLSSKGSNLESPYVVPSAVAPSKFLFFGLQDSDSMVRVLKASALLRSQGVDTELIERVIEPEMLPWKKGMIPLSEFKHKLVEQVWKENRGKKKDQAPRLAAEQIPALAKVLENTTFFITIRSTQVGERLEDLKYASTKEDFLTIVANAFTFINMTEAIKAKKDSSYEPKYFDIESQDDIDVYFLDYLPKRTARNFARMHNLGLVHKYPHAGNISIVGSIYDLDSEYGEPLGDDKVKISEVFADINTLLEGNESVLRHLRDRGFLSHGVSINNQFKPNFIRQYISELGEHLFVGYFSKGLHEIGFDITPEEYDIYLSNFFDILGWKFTYKENLANLPFLFFTSEQTSLIKKIEDIHTEVASQKGDSDNFRKSWDRKNFRRTLEQHYAVFIRKRVNEQLYNRYSLEINDTTERYGEDISNAVVDFMSGSITEPYLSLSKQNLYGWEDWLYRRYITEKDWESDILSHIYDIYNLYDQFLREEDIDAFNYFLSLTMQQLSWDFVINNAPPEVMESDLDYGIYVVERFHIERGKEYENLKQRYGEDAVEAVQLMFCEREIKKFPEQKSQDIKVA